ncbi:leukotriene A-4 hydrolase [Parasteatoda tepidariorum]|uniref:Leukotriene A(4) hydrolase n=1 Tax=Parasteatoda tepidariorum TaxID=114398 RepID=A0A2L2Y8X6_PARTP|nr:leukotriene A-4 hydrolase [Parasteatoda tepidariorum]
MSQRLSENDPHSYSNPEDAVITDIFLKLEVDFNKHILSGYVDLTVEKKNPKADLFLDTKDLIIHNVKNKSNHNKLSFILSEEKHEVFGSRLEIKLPKRSTAKNVFIRIDYETSPQASALQWLEPSQTAGKKHPYVFSLCQAIHARSILPCQDTPSVKAPYSATLTTPYELIALMSALRDGEEMDSDPLEKNYKFVQKIPIPSYLITLAVGALESRQIGPRSHVWAEAEFVEKAAEEFADTEKMLSCAEELIGEYVWEVYDLLVLPPSFAYGGMENPCLTFVTPTIITGDKSLVSVIAHEIAHSWSGNLVTNKNFEHFWLNEGFTMFFERKIIAKLHGEKKRHFDAIDGWNDLDYIVKKLGETDPLTKLVPDLTDVDPDEGCNPIPYEKGHTFLFYLETLLGSKPFEEFLRNYIKDHKFQSIDTDTWKNYLLKHFSDKKDVLNQVDWDTWLYSPGMPPVKPDYDETLAKECIDLCNAWVKADENDLGQFGSKDIKSFVSDQIVTFLSFILKEDPLSTKKIEKLNELYNLSETKNCEIEFRWIRLCLLARWKDIIPTALDFVVKYGRLKYIKPIYVELYRWEETREAALSTYKEHSSEMMVMSASAIAKELKVNQ